MSAQSDAPPVRFVARWRTDPGKRKNNEDVVVLMEGPAAGRPAGDLLFGVVDGMGGYQAGEVAARIARDVLYERFAAGGTDVGAWLEGAHRAVVDDAREHPDRGGMGAVVTIGLLSGDCLHIAHVGDTRLYRYREGRLEQLTADQSATGELVRAGQLSKDVARTHPMSNVVYQAIGHLDRPPEPLVSTGEEVRQGDLFLANSDGLSDVITDEQIAAILADSSTLQEAADRLIEAALTDQVGTDMQGKPVRIPGGRDNITVVLVKVIARDDARTADTERSSASIRSFWRRVLGLLSGG